MPSVNDILQNESIKHSHYLYRYQTYEVNRALSIINESQEAINRELLKRADIENWTTKRQEDLLNDVTNIQKEYQKKLDTLLNKDMKDLTVQEQKYNLVLLANTIKPFKEIVVSDRLIPPNVIYAMSKDSYLMLADGTTLKPREFVKSIVFKDNGQILQSIRQGMITGQNGATIKRDLINTYGMQRNHADSLVRTLTNHYSSEARNIVGRENSDIIKGYQWISTLDNSTCFTEGHKVKTIDGDKNIEDLKEDDLVLTGKNRYKKVNTLFNKEVNELVEIELENGEIIHCTPDHLFLLEDGTWEEAENLLPSISKLKEL